MKEVIFSKDGEAVADFNAEKHAYKLLTQDILHISNELVLNYVRVMIREGAIDVANVKITFIDPFDDTKHNIVCDKNGRFQYWPKYLGDDCRALMRLM